MHASPWTNQMRYITLIAQLSGIYGNVNRPCPWATPSDQGRFTAINPGQLCNNYYMYCTYMDFQRVLVQTDIIRKYLQSSVFYIILINSAQLYNLATIICTEVAIGQPYNTQYCTFIGTTKKELQIAKALPIRTKKFTTRSKGAQSREVPKSYNKNGSGSFARAKALSLTGTIQWQ